MRLGLLLLLGLLGLSLVQAAPAADLITNLPGAPDGWNSTFQMYSGYLTVTDRNDTFLHYWFVESARDPTTDPVLLWLNGGPGASSLMGFFTEHGPFRPNPDGTTLSAYPYSWNQIANVIYLEAPAGVGFSYSLHPEQYITNDNKTAIQNYEALMAWFDLFPEFKANDFWITGESYGGKYCPELADVVLNHIQAGDIPWLNMKGVIVGNPGTESDWYGAPDEYAYMTTLYNHFIIPQFAYYAAYNACGWDNFVWNCDGDYTTSNDDCKKAILEAVEYLPPVLDPYDLYAPVCLNTAPESERAKRWNKSFRNFIPYLATAPDTVTFYPCLSDFQTTYLNLPEVQEAIHVKSMTWDEIGSIIYLNEYKYSVVPIWQRFINETDWHLLVYSGDVDSAVPTIGTERWIECLDLPVVNKWRPWMYNNQTAGFWEDFQGISFITIKGAGHMVPYYLPAQGYAFFEMYMSQWY